LIYTHKYGFFHPEIFNEWIIKSELDKLESDHPPPESNDDIVSEPAFKELAVTVPAHVVLMPNCKTITKPIVVNVFIIYIFNKNSGTDLC
jgi:hypothetical protein